jgi:hypothetical protein
VEGERRDDGRKKGDSRDQSGAKSRNMGRRHESRACWGHDRSVCVFAKLVVIRQGRVEGEEGRGVECETTWIRLSLREKKGEKQVETTQTQSIHGERLEQTRQQREGGLKIVDCTKKDG